MTLFEIIVLAIIQGLTEFLPISSSAHLILPAEVLGWRTMWRCTLEVYLPL